MPFMNELVRMYVCLFSARGPMYNCIVDYFMSHSSTITHFAILKASVCALDSLGSCQIGLWGVISVHNFDLFCHIIKRV